MSSVLVTGGAGFIGSVVTEQLLAAGFFVTVLDDLRNGHASAVHPDARLIQMDLLDRERLISLFRAHRFDAVMHLAAEALIDESIRDPGRFFGVNVCGGLNLLDAMVIGGVRALVFSSTAAVYGEPNRMPVDEAHSKEPVNAYGESKLAFERALPWYGRSHGVQHVSLRYFNACGASMLYGEDREKETHLIPVALDAASGRRPRMVLFGSDYETPDGTCVRDYVHVVDIAAAHLLVLEHLAEVSGRAYNLGSGVGYTNAEVIDTVRRVTGADFPVVRAPRRPGDPARLVASSAAIRADLGWSPRYEALDEMIRSAWDWRRTHPHGYSS